LLILVLVTVYLKVTTQGQSNVLQQKKNKHTNTENKHTNTE